jgi:hypothetical protein
MKGALIYSRSILSFWLTRDYPDIVETVHMVHTDTQGVTRDHTVQEDTVFLVLRATTP